MANNLGLRAQTFHFENWAFTMNLHTDIVVGDVGKALALDTSAANTVKLAGDGDEIFGRLETFEDRTQQGIKIGAVSRKFQAPLPIKDGETVNVGDQLVGAGAGEVKARPASAVAGATTGDIDGAADAATLAKPVTAVQIDGTNAIAFKE